MRMKLLHAAAALFMFMGCSKSEIGVGASSRTSNGQSEMRQCEAGAKRLIGQSAVVLRCGKLTASGSLEALAVTRLSNHQESARAVAAARVIVIRAQGNVWIKELDAKRQITNPMGYIGIDYIDDSYTFYGYELEVTDHRSDGVSGMTLWFSYLDSKGRATDGIPVQVSWNPTAHRFQEFTTNEEPEGFKAEVKNPPHRKICVGCSH